MKNDECARRDKCSTEDCHKGWWCWIERRVDGNGGSKATGDDCNKHKLEKVLDAVEVDYLSVGEKR